MASGLVERVDLMGIEPTTPCLRSVQGANAGSIRARVELWLRLWLSMVGPLVVIVVSSGVVAGRRAATLAGR